MNREEIFIFIFFLFAVRLKEKVYMYYGSLLGMVFWNKIWKHIWCPSPFIFILQGKKYYSNFSFQIMRVIFYATKIFASLEVFFVWFFCSSCPIAVFSKEFLLWGYCTSVEGKICDVGMLFLKFYTSCGVYASAPLCPIVLSKALALQYFRFPFPRCYNQKLTRSY